MRRLETTLWICGTLLIALFFAAQAWSEYASRREISRFAGERQYLASPSPARERTAELPPRGERVSADAPSVVLAGVSMAADATIAVLHIPEIELQVPIGYGTSERVLLRGAGLVEGSAQPGSDGNVAIAAHRDSFFRGLKDVSIGALVELETPQGRYAYRITELYVVEPTAVHVLADVGLPVLTLVTCYPFYFVGHAPQRFIVRAVAVEVPTQVQQEKQE